MQTAAIKPPKVYVAVRVEFTADGTMLPRELTWEDGEKYEIDNFKSSHRKSFKEHELTNNIMLNIQTNKQL